VVHVNVKEHLDKYEESWILTPLKFNYNLTFSPWMNLLTKEKSTNFFKAKLLSFHLVLFCFVSFLFLIISTNDVSFKCVALHERIMWSNWEWTKIYWRFKSWTNIIEYMLWNLLFCVLYMIENLKQMRIVIHH
jgi:uncharacterized BrkB/YihY/UPF0761 family membrane protein